jgi:hypothetical protein
MHRIVHQVQRLRATVQIKIKTRRCLYAESRARVFPRLVSHLPQGGELSYLTDVEGNLNYFHSFIQRSRVLKFDSNTDHSSLTLRDGAYFCYGGDVFDRGPGDIRIANTLIRLKRRYPDRVFLIMGNRDINKLRLASELHESDLRRNLNELPGPYFMDATNRISVTMALKRRAGYSKEPVQLGDHVTSAADEELQSRLAPFNTPVNRLKYILEHTMGAPRAFEYRRQELAELRRGPTSFPASSITDEDVLTSYRRSIDPARVDRGDDAFVYEYLRCAQLGLVFGDALIVHGGVCPRSVGYLPVSVPASLNDILEDNSICTVGTHTAAQWIHALNEWAQQELQDWSAGENRFFNADRTRRAAERLMGYANPKAMSGRTVVYNGFMRGGNPQPISAAAVKYLNNNGIHRLLVGHQPHGNCPTVVRSSQLLAVNADTGYSDPTSSDGRGRQCACSEVILSKDDTCVHGVINGDNGKKIEIEYRLATNANANVSDPYIGRCTTDGWWVKAKSRSQSDGDNNDSRSSLYLLARGEGFKVSYQWKSAEETKALEFSSLD